MCLFRSVCGRFDWALPVFRVTSRTPEVVLVLPPYQLIQQHSEDLSPSRRVLTLETCLDSCTEASRPERAMLDAASAVIPTAKAATYLHNRGGRENDAFLDGLLAV
jgi:hypothetical protein